ncbi:MAG: hypothetical protein ABF888_00010 [Acetobacter papayae]
MKVFLSWSGERSKKVAQLLKDWLPRVIQSLDPWISTQDIQKGSLWSEVIGDQLQGMTTGIICLTMENKERPWILFEAGALAKGLTTNRVCTFLIDLQPTDITAPLSQFNHTNPTMKEDVLHLLQTLNDRIKENKLRSDILENALEVHWPYFNEEFENIKKSIPSPEKMSARTEDDILREILENTRSLTHRVSAIENRNNHEKSGNIYINTSTRLNKEKETELIQFRKIYTIANKLKRDGIDYDTAYKKLIVDFPLADNKNLLALLRGVFDEG